MKKWMVELIPMRSVRRKLKQKYFPKQSVEKTLSEGHCLMVCPHPDDEMLGAGGVLLKYAKNFDCLCMASAGVKTPKIDAEPRANLRIKEFHQVMDSVGIKNRWIFKTWGVPPMNDQIEKYFKDYCQTVDTKEYDYIFLPHPNDNHPEHKYITNNLFKRLLKKVGYKKSCKIVFYEVWQPIQHVNHYEDISDVAQKKFKTIELYASQNIWIYYPDRVEGLNKYRGMLYNNVPYAEAYEIVSIRKYLKRKK